METTQQRTTADTWALALSVMAVLALFLQAPVNLLSIGIGAAAVAIGTLAVRRQSSWQGIVGIALGAAVSGFMILAVGRVFYVNFF